MPSTIEYRDMLAGPMRQWMKDAGGESKWADEFCDGLLLRLIQPTCSYKIHLWSNKNGVYQINIDEDLSGGYTVDYDSDPLKAIGERLAPRTVVRSTDARKKGN